MAPPAPAPQGKTPPPAPRRRPPWLGSLTLVLIPAALLVAALAGAVWWMSSTSNGLRTLLWSARWVVPSLSAEGVTGSVRSGFAIERLTIDEARWTMTATGVTLVPRALDWKSRTIDLEQLGATTVTVAWTADDSAERSGPPDTLAPPVQLHLRDARIGELRLGPRDAEPQRLLDVRLQGSASREAFRVERAQARHGDTEVALRGTLQTTSPFPLAAEADIRSTLLEQALQASVQADGTLLDARVRAASDSPALRGTAEARLTPFEPVPLAALALAVSDFDVRRWAPDAPQMRLTATADLRPHSTPGGDFALAGPFRVTNALPGPVDRERIPVRSARGALRWSAASLDLAIERLEGAGGWARAGLVRAADGSLTARVAFNGLDAAQIHTAATATQASGELDYRLADGRQRFAGRAVNSRGLPMTAEFALELADQVLDVQRAVARLGDGRADVSGRVRLGDQTAAQLRGEFQALDLSQFVAGLDTRLNGRFDVDGTLQPVRRGRADVTLTDSRIAGRPLEGRADLRLDGELLDVDTQLRSGAARLAARGGLGAGRQLAFELSAPQLAELTREVAGSLEARGVVRGSVDDPSLEATATAGALRLPNKHRIERVEATIRGGRAPQTPLEVAVTVTGHEAPGQPDISMSTATLTAQGTTAKHQLRFDATTGSRQPVTLTAQGGWQQDAWRGTLTSALAGKPLDLRLDKPAPLVIGAGSVAFGPAALTARETRFTEVEVFRTGSGWRSAGAFSDLQPQALDPRARAPRRAVRTTAADPVPLTLAGRWAIEYDTAVSGIVVVERTAGDLYGGVDAVNPIGISDIGAALNIVDNRVTGTAYLRGRALGKVDAVVDAYLDPEEMRLAQQRPLRIGIDAVLPDLGWIGPLIGDLVQVQGAGTVQATVGGTPADPTADGKVQARDLRLVWIEQGLRLENGTLDAALEDGVLVVNEMTFSGDSRVRPDERRAVAAANGGPGTLTVVGRIALQTLTGSIGVRADRLPILQRRDRWMVVSGEGGITLTPTRAELYARPLVDGAYIDFAAMRGPRNLPNDVVVVRREQAQKPKPAAPLDVFVNVEGRLGERFYIRGAGLEARLAGDVAVTGRPSQLQAVGTVRIVDGLYNGYGQRLQIQRGVVTFSGPLENPALNVLAVRTGLPMEVGVQISGSALAPIVRLHSDIAMPDVEKLNWLVLGRPPGAGDGQERALLTAAASALFAGQSDGATSGILRSLGIDEFGIRAGQTATSLLPRETVAGTLRSGRSSTAAADFVALGKRINDDLYVTFEQAISGAEYYVALSYQLSRRVSVIARAGSTNALDLVYSFAFD